jgi:hypothetical protein
VLWMMQDYKATAQVEVYSTALILLWSPGRHRDPHWRESTLAESKNSYTHGTLQYHETIALAAKKPLC